MGRCSRVPSCKQDSFIYGGNLHRWILKVMGPLRWEGKRDVYKCYNKESSCAKILFVDYCNFSFS